MGVNNLREKFISILPETILNDGFNHFSYLLPVTIFLVLFKIQKRIKIGLELK